MKLEFEYIWIPSALGGHNTPPYEDMRTTIRWQKYLNEFLQSAKDVQWEEFTYDPETLQGKATCYFTSKHNLPEDWLREGELVEFLSGFRVLAIGRIIK